MAALWAVLAVPIWLVAYATGITPPSALLGPATWIWLPGYLRRIHRSHLTAGIAVVLVAS
ncbi:MAG: hypothetical protein KGJ78_16470 [Alphaproteobacteria bacterium]|nr:hypothetical protein [Alphaproteobacteria bacterium]